MKIYFHMNFNKLSNCYVVVNEADKKAIIIDPGKITTNIIDQIEDEGYELCAALITHNHSGHTEGLKTLRKIYDLTVYAADGFIAGAATRVIRGDGTIKAAGLNISYFALPGHSADSIVYKIGNVLFTGDTIENGLIGSTYSNYAKKMLITGIRQKILTQQDDTIIMPGHGPLSTVGAESMFNTEVSER